ncbi:MAG: sugar phosphate isomerase/epimerase [Planctomycetes bacterium]|nr:sugar phosphate isomerase/epimerase [Planctomycetota bacterium]
MKVSSLPFGFVHFEDEDSFSAWFDYAEEIGLEGVELMYPWPVSWHVIDRAHKRLAGRKLEVSMITTHCDPSQFRDDLRKAEAKKLAGYIDLALDFQCRFVRVIAGRFDPTIREVSVAKAINAVVQTFELVLPHAEKAGVVLALENHPGFGVSRAVVAQLLQRIPSASFGWNFDMENAYRIPGQTAFDFLNDAAMMRRLVHVHAKNFAESADGWISDVALDEGVNDVAAMLAKVKASGYDDWISIEFAGKTQEKLRRSAAFLRDVWKSLPQRG